MTVSNVMKVLDKDRLERKLQAYGEVFQKTDRIVSGRKLRVMVKDQVPPDFAQIAGWTDGEDISLNGGLLLEQLSDKGRDQNRVIAYVKGVNYHELAHCLFTPRIGGEGTLSTRVQKRAEADHDVMVWHSFNILEDQRAETLFVAKYRPSRHYFQAIALEYLLNDPALVPSQYPLIHHRLWIPSETRAGIAKLYEQRLDKKGHAKLVGDVIDQYVRLQFPADNDRGFDLVMEFYELLKADSLVQRVSPENHQGEGIIVKGKLKKGEQGDASKKIDGMIVDLSQDDEGSDDDEGDEDDDAEGGGAGKPDDTEGDEEPGEGPTMIDITDLLEGISEALDELMEDEDFVDDIETTQEAVRDAEANIPGGVGRGRGGQLKWTGKDPEVADTSAVRRVVKDLEQLRFELTGTWQRHAPSGKVNPYDFYTADAGDLDFFDRWTEGIEDQGGFEVVLLVDRSSSMSDWDMDKACRVAWVLKRALEEVESEVTVMTYTDLDYHMLYQPYDKAEQSKVKVARPEGGTNPRHAIEEAARLLDRSEKPNKLLVNVTDGGWGDAPTNDQAVTLLNSMGIHTALVGLNGAVGSYGDHNHQVAVDVQDISEISTFVEQLVANVLRSILQRT